MVKKVLLFCALVFGFTSYAFAEVKYLEYYTLKDGEIANKFYFDVHDPADGLQKIFTTTVEGHGSAQMVLQDEFYIESSGNTKSWLATSLNDNGMETRYSGKRDGNKIVIEGKWKGKKADRELEIDEDLFFYNPKISLTPFILSKEKEIEFWGLRQDNLTAFKMIAKRQGEEVIRVDGKPVEAIKVYWTVDGLGSMFFKRTYWFRKSDGLYIKQLTSDGGIRELISEGARRLR